MNPSSPPMQGMAKRPSLFTLIILIALASTAAVLYTPGIPDIQRQFHVSLDAVHWTMTIFLIGYAFGQLIYGPLANRIRRKPTLYIGIAVGIIGSLLSAISGVFHNFSVLLIGRFLQAIGMSCGLAMTLTMINDVYTHEESRRVIAFTSSAFAILPGLAVYVGGILVSYFHWESTFYFLALYSLFVLGLCILLPETSPHIDITALQLKNIIRHYWQVSRSMRVWCYSLMWGLCTTMIYIFASVAPTIAISTMKLPPAMFGAFNLIPSSGILIGTLSSGIFARHYKARTIMLIGIILTSLACLALLLFSQLGQLTPWTLFLPTFCIYLGTPAIVSNASALITKNIIDKATVSSLLSFINVSTAVIGLFVIGLIPGNPEHILPEVFITIALCFIFLFSVTRRWQ